MAKEVKIPSELRTPEMREALYREWVDTAYNSDSQEDMFLANLASIATALLALVFVSLSITFSENIDCDMSYTTSTIFIVACIIGIIIIFKMSKKAQKKAIKLEKVKKAIKVCEDSHTCKCD